MQAQETRNNIGLSVDARYAAMKARDARFDGCFFTGVTSTGIYCRPVCSVKAPSATGASRVTSLEALARLPGDSHLVRLLASGSTINAIKSEALAPE